MLFQFEADLSRDSRVEFSRDLNVEVVKFLIKDLRLIIRLRVYRKEIIIYQIFFLLAHRIAMPT